MILVNSTDLTFWADRLEARSQLPRLIRRLIYATASDIQQSSFAADEGIQLSGWDGIVNANVANMFVPANVSVWEMGVNKDPKSKADDDYQKRSQNPLGLTPADTTFVFVTLRRWNGKETWIQARNAEGIWREVRAYDAEDLAQWLEEASAVHLWLSVLLGKHPHSALSLDDFWIDWAGATKPPLSPNLVIGGREPARDRILTWFRGTPSVLTMQGDSPEEAVAFLSAVAQTLSSEEKVVILSRAVVVDDIAAWRGLILSSAPLFLIARFDQPEIIGRAIQKGHHVFVPLGRVGATGAFPLPRLIRDAAKQALDEMGQSGERAEDLATLARRSLSALRRKLAIAPGVQVPAWAQPNEARNLIAPLLAGAWKDSSKGDRSALSDLAGIPYEQFQHHAVSSVNAPDPPLLRVGDVWMIAAREDAWRLIARYLTADDLERFEEVALKVLSELDPAFELPPEKRFAASIYGKNLSRSGLLREGIAETLAMMASLSPEVSFAASKTGEEVARKIVWRLLETARGNGDLWASLAYLLPLLAEAAPKVVLDAVEAGLAGENPVLVNLFQDQTVNVAWSSSSPHTGLLWALETLAWNPNYLGKAALCLAHLARLDPGGGLVNRPALCLPDIFICSHPNTSAPLQSRLAVLDTIGKREPEIAWHLLMALLPNHHSAVSRTHGTKWRDWVPDRRIEVTCQEYIDATNTILERLLSKAGANVERWCSLIVSISNLMSEQQEVLLQRLEDLDLQCFTASEQSQLQSCVRKEILRHRDFPDARWAMPITRVDRLEKIYDPLESADCVTHSVWLFKHEVELPGMRDISWQEEDKIVWRHRTEALREILNTHDWSGVLRLAEQVKQPDIVGSTLARSNLLSIDLNVFLHQNLASLEQWRNHMARGFVSERAVRDGERWIADCLTAALNSWTAEQYGEFFLCLAFNSTLLKHLDAAGEETQRYFWSRVQHVNLLEVVDTDPALAFLLKFDRPHVAVNAIKRALSQKPNSIAPERIAEILEAAILTAPEPGFHVSGFAYKSAELLNRLEARNLSRDRLAKLEWLYFRIHENYRSPHILHKEMSCNPEFFIELLQCIYPPKNELQPEESENKIARARLPWELLESWKQMPGQQKDGTVDLEALRGWVLRVRELAAACDRSEIADIHIGQALAFSPIDSDGTWPHQNVRDLIEELANSDIENAWQIQIFNNRGVTCRSITAGGEPERILAERYESYAKQMYDLWPRTAGVMHTLAEDYRHQALHQDQQAELTQDFWR